MKAKSKRLPDVPSEVKAYAPVTVLVAQRRVLKLARAMLQALPAKERNTLRTDGAGLMTFDELIDHMRQAANLEVRWSKEPK